MRLKKLELQGYKTFALRTDFLFTDGITAIVGPNGSGKSNIADAVRWVLGEQSYRLLRAKRTEDMIFHGSTQRARVGMAHASLTLNNADGWIPLDFSEVTISRRAYRSGENEYYLNGSRVRLKDVSELLAKSGLVKKSSIVIGQGHIDAALSLRPEERRTLFEEAANITLYQNKRADAISKLEATKQNLLRVRAIIAEIEPRLKTLRRQAKQAEIADSLNKDLEALLQTWYGYHWRRGVRALQEARERLNEARQRLAEHQARSASIEDQSANLRAERLTLRQQLADWHKTSGDLHARMEQVQRELAVIQERSRLIGQQLSEAQEDIAPLKTSRNAQAERTEEAEARLQALSDELEQTRANLTDLEDQAQAQQAAREQMLAQMTSAQNRLFDLATQLADRRNRLAQLAERRSEQEEEKTGLEATIAAQENQLTVFRQERRSAESRLADIVNQSEQLQASLDDARQTVQSCQSRARDIEQQLARTREEEASVAARLDMLQQLQAEGAGLQSGTRAVLAAARQGRLQGILGTLSEHIRVPPELERAIEASLGPHLQDIVTETWRHAEEAIQYLYREGAGRATFLPLDNLRVPAPPSPQPSPGFVGNAARLVQAQEHIRPAADLLLGRTFIVEDMDSARALHNQMTGSFQIATRKGELLRSSGAVSGGAEGEQALGLLSRSRERDELTGSLRDLAQRRAEIEASLASNAVEQKAAQDACDRHQRELEALAQKEASLRESLAERQREADKGAQEMEWRQGLIRQAAQALAALDDKQRQLEAEMQTLTEQERETQERLAELRAEIESLPDNLAVPLAEAKAAVSLVEQNVESQKAILRSHRQSLAQLESQLAARRSRIQALQEERASLEAAEKDFLRRAEAQSAELDSINARIRPAEERLSQIETDYFEREEHIRQERAALREAEQNHNRALLDMERRRDELASLKRQIEADLGLIDVEAAEGLQTQPPLPLRPVVSSLPTVETLPPNLEKQMRQLRGQVRRIGAVNPTAPAEYAETLERHRFLVTQSEDLQEAAKSLRAAIAELDAIMNQEFTETFEAVAEQFTLYFARLFGGGTARLVLTDPESPMESGVDIIARPPGKRTQSLALLSGGERSLAAVALIFAILKVSPAPFCFLDEVDAMLDESNVRRFRDVLEELAETTQFIVITHNRGTIEAARTIYGVSMGADSVSKVLSLQLDQVEAKA